MSDPTPLIKDEVSVGLNVAEDRLVVAIACGSGLVCAKLDLRSSLKLLSLVQAAVIRMEKKDSPRLLMNCPQCFEPIYVGQDKCQRCLWDVPRVPGKAAEDRS